MRIPAGRPIEWAIRSYIRPSYKVFAHRRELKPLSDRTAAIPAGGIVAFIVARNESAIVPKFLEHYRAMGVAHFIFIDNESDDGMGDMLAQEPDCSVWIAKGSYRASGHGLAWLNHMLRRHGTGRWCLTLDADEFLVFPHCDTRSLPELTAHLDELGRRSFYTVLLDMYPKGPLNEAAYEPGRDPLDVCGWYDPYGYHQLWNEGHQQVFVHGGVRRRVYFSDRPEISPSLNKVPLVRWRRHYAYYASTHVLVPPRRNYAHHADYVAPTGVLLHFKLFASILEKAREEMQRRQHWAGGSEYEVYLRHHSDSKSLWNEASAEYRDWRQLVDHGLMNIGTWV